MRNFKKFLALLLATMMVLGGMVTVSAAEEKAASDYEATYFASAEDLAALGIVKGTVDTTLGNDYDYALEGDVTRWQMALFIARIMTGETNDGYWNMVTDNTTPFEDVVNYFGAISYVTDKGVIKGKGYIPGVGDNCFDPNGKITYAEALTMAVRALGELQLQYPNGFLKAAEELGLTAGLEALNQDDALTRGQMIQILYNLLYAKKDGAASFAEQNFGLETAVYVLVATNNQAMAETAQVEKTDYVALAKLNADGTYAYNDYLYVNVKELGITAAQADAMMGYSWTVSSFDGLATVYEYAPNDVKTIVDYGTGKDTIKSATGLYNVNNSKFVTIDGTKYQLVESYSNLNNKSTYTGNATELIVQSLYESGKSTSYTYYRYAADGSILNKEGTAIAIQNFYGTYYVIDGTYVGADGNTYNSYRLATDEDFAACAVSLASGVNADSYGVITDAAKLLTSNYAEITMIDDNNDGVYDRAIYIPYTIGYYTNSTEKDGVWNASTGKSVDDTAVVTINGIIQGAYVASETFDYGTQTFETWKKWVRAADITYAGEGKPANNSWIVYHYNPYSRVITVVEKLPVQNGVVTGYYSGTQAYDKTNLCYYFTGAQVTVNGATYALGLRPQCDYNLGDTLATDGLTYMDAANGDELNKYGYDADIAVAYANPAYQTLNYIVLDNTIIYAALKNGSYDWIAFDYGKGEQTVNGAGFATVTYTGDIIGVDANDNIVVKAYTPKSSAQQKVAIGEINGYNYGILVADYAAIQYQYTGIGILQNGSYDTMIRKVIADFFKTLTADLTTDAEEKAGEEYHQLMYVVDSVDEATGALNIYTDIDLYYPSAYISSYRQPDYIISKNSGDKITFNYGISHIQVEEANGKVDGKAAVIVLNKNSVLVVIGKDGIKVHTGIPADGKQLNTSTTDVRFYSLTDNYIVAASKDLTCAQIWNGGFDTDLKANLWNYYLVVGDSSADKYDGNTQVKISTNEAGQFVYTYTDLYCLNTGAYAPAMPVVGGLPGYNDFASTYTGVKPVGAIYAEKDGQYKLLTEISYTGNNTGLVNYPYAVNSEAVLRALLSPAGYTDADNNVYSGVHTRTEKTTSALGDINNGYTVRWADGRTEFDSLLKYCDTITYYYTTAGVVNKINIDNDKSIISSSYFKSGDAYFTWVKDVSFQCAVVKKGSDVVILDLYKEEKKEDLAAYNTTYTDLVNEGKAAIDAATTKAGVDAAFAAAKAAIDKAVNDAAAAAAAQGVTAVSNANGVTTITIKDADGNLSSFAAYAKNASTNLFETKYVFALNADAEKTVSITDGTNAITCTANWAAAQNADGSYTFTITAKFVGALNDTQPVIKAGTYTFAVIDGTTIDMDNAREIVVG